MNPSAIPYSVLDLATRGRGPPSTWPSPEIDFLPARKEVVHAFSDHAKLHRIFGEQPTVPLDEGLRRMARWASEAGVRDPIRFESVEVLRNMPPSWAEGLTQTV